MTTTNDTNTSEIDQDAEVPDDQQIPEVNEHDDTEVQDDSNDDTDEDSDDDTDEDSNDGQEGGGRRNREAQYRRRAQAAEAERDQLRAQLDALHRQMVGDIARGAGLPAVELLESAGHDLSSFITDEGTVERAKVIEATRTTMRRYNIRPGLAPNPQQGAHGIHGKTGGVAGVINEALGR